MHPLQMAILALAIAVAAAGAAGLGGRFSLTLDVASHFAPLCLGASVFTAACALAMAQGPALVLSTAGGAASLALLAPDLIGRARTSPRQVDGSSLKVIQFNLWRSNEDVAATVAWLADQAADIVVLEEVIDAAASVPAALSEVYPWQSGGRIGTWILARRAPSENGAYRARSTKTHSTGAWAHFEDDEGGFTVFGFQATWPIPPGPQARDSRDLAQFLRRFDQASLIICGDFNSTPWSGAMRRQDRAFGIRRLTRACFTWPVRPFFGLRLRSPAPFLAIDHIYAGSAWRPARVRVGPRLGSDHRPVTAVLERVSA
jgi:endonuclease/exonuclease/phosphatase (EEP) superfamily protein YafD